MNKNVQSILEDYQLDKTRLIDILWDVQRQQGYISDQAVGELAAGLNMSSIDVQETLSFYHFFHSQPSGKHKIYLSNTVIAGINGYNEVRLALEQETGCSFGGMNHSNTFALYDTSCIGLSDQEPAMMIDDVVFTCLTPKKVSAIIELLKQGKTAAEIANPLTLSSKDVVYIDTMVASNIRNQGSVFFKNDRNYKSILKNCLDIPPEKVIEIVTASKIRGRGGAGFSTGLKWQLGRNAEADEKYIICNADEGEPGTFKDRVLLTRSPKDVLLGMVIAAYAIGARCGILYLRAEYGYLKDYLQQQIQEFYDLGLLGRQILDHAAFDFDIRIQMGAGAYICGDETALIESCEGKRGTPRVKPPYPIQQGYLGKPTSINNVETFAAISRIIEEGPVWFSSMGTDDSTGTRLLCVSGDCQFPGIYEIEWGLTLNEVLQMVGARQAKAVQVSGPSGECVSVAKDGARKFCYSDLSCNGSLMVFDESRDILSVVKHFMEFFVDESCGICVPCRAGGVELLHKVKAIIDGQGRQQDVDEIISWGRLLQASRCGLGTTAAKPILTTLEKFPEIYQQKLVRQQSSLLPSFNREKALRSHDQAYKTLVRDKVS